MSKVWKGVKKHFKRVIKVLKKVVPIVLAVAAIYFTAGAALGWGAAAGWGGAAASAGSVFGSGVLASTVTGAVYSAGVGAAVGGVMSKAMGGSFTEGAQRGALTGAVAGGVLGFAGYTPPVADGATPPAAGGIPPPTEALTPPGVTTSPMPDSLGYGIPSGGEVIPNLQPPVGGLPALDTQLADTAIAGGQGGAVPTAPSGLDQAAAVTQDLSGAVPEVMASPTPLETIKNGAGKILGKDGWLANNQTLAGMAVQGIGGAMQGNAATEAQQGFMDQKRANYEGSDPGRNYRKLASPSPSNDRYDPRSYGSWEYKYDPAQGRIIKVPVGEGG